jgi:hypothetical protein
MLVVTAPVVEALFCVFRLAVWLPLNKVKGCGESHLKGSECPPNARRYRPVIMARDW